MLLDSDRLAKEREAIAIERRELEQSVEKLAVKEAELKQKENEVAEREGFGGRKTEFSNRGHHSIRQ